MKGKKIIAGILSAVIVVGGWYANKETGGVATKQIKNITSSAVQGLKEWSEKEDSKDEKDDTGNADNNISSSDSDSNELRFSEDAPGDVQANSSVSADSSGDATDTLIKYLEAGKKRRGE